MGFLATVNVLFDKLVKSYLSFKENDRISCFSSIINCSESPILSAPPDPELRVEPQGVNLSCAILIETSKTVQNYPTTQGE